MHPVYLPQLSASEWSTSTEYTSIILIQASDEITKVDARLLSPDAREALAGVDYAQNIALVYLAGVMNGSSDAFIMRIAAPQNPGEGQWGNTLVVDAIVRLWSQGPANIVFPYQVVTIPRSVIPIEVLPYTVVLLNVDFMGMDQP